MNATSDYYRDKAAAVTGGASGIGLALAETMLSYGASKVVLADFDDNNLQRETARLNAAHPGKVLGFHCDVTKEEDVQRMIHEAARFGERVDMLFNNAGAGLSGFFDVLTNEDQEKAFALNFYGALYGIRAVLPIMRRQGSGHIVNIISGIAFMPRAQQTMYAATKAALNGLTLALRYELWDENIRVTSATPGTTATAIWKAGGGKPPPYAQSPEQSAQTVLAGVARNERLVLGSRADLSGVQICFNPDAAARVDEYLLNAARKRRGGEWVEQLARTLGPYIGPVPIVTHLHGGHNAQESDGFAEAWFLPAANNIPGGFATEGTWYDFFKTEFQSKFGVGWEPGTATFQYQNDQRAGTFWYHDHTLGMTRLNVYAGPAGFYLLRSGPGDLPTGILPGPAPGVGADPLGTFYEVPLAIQDRSFNADGSLFYPDTRAFFDDFAGPYIPGSDVPPIWNPEFFGDTMVVNGRTWPSLEVEPRRYRFRCLNGCNARFLILKIVTSPLAKRPATAALPFWPSGRLAPRAGFCPRR